MAQGDRLYDVGGVLLPRPFKIRRLGHFGVNVTDMEAGLRFYRDLLGVPVHSWDPRVRVIETDRFRFQRRKWGTPGHPGAGPCHFAFGVQPEAIDGIASLLQERGLLARGPIDFGVHGRSVFCFDPDDNEVEFSDYWARLAGAVG